MAYNSEAPVAMPGTGPSGAQASKVRKTGTPGMPADDASHNPASQPAAQGYHGTIAQQAPTFAQLQQQGRARPAPPAPAPAQPMSVPQDFSPRPTVPQIVPSTAPGASVSPPNIQGGGYGGSGVYGGLGGVSGGGTSVVNPRDSADVRASTRALLLQQLANPAGFGQAEVQDWYRQGGEAIDDQFSQRRTALEEDMARRGLSASSVLGGRMADLNVGRRSAEVALRDSLGRQLAEELSRSRNEAIQSGTNFDKFMTEAAAKNADLSLQAQKINADQNLGFADLDLKSRLGFDSNDIDRQKLGEDARQYDSNYGLEAAKFGEDQYQSDVDAGHFDRNFDENVRRFGIGDAQWERDFDWRKKLDTMKAANDTDFVNPYVDPNDEGGVEPEFNPEDFF